jgi:protein-L-isoaspartate(D-aspartate) O-methyltransferase
LGSRLGSQTAPSRTSRQCGYRESTAGARYQGSEATAGENVTGPNAQYTQCAPPVDELEASFVRFINGRRAVLLGSGRMDLDAPRRAYAEELRVRAQLRNEALVRAFATVPREHFLGPGPWQLMLPPYEASGGVYITTDDAAPSQLYRNVIVAIDAARFLNNGHPSSLAAWFDSLELQPGDHVLHVGCGVGYYTAVLAETVGERGRVTGVEIDGDLADRARANLAYLRHVSVMHCDGAALDPGPCDAIFVNAGATQPRRVWLDGLRAGGRLLLPLTASLSADDTNMLGVGMMLKVTRHGDGYAAGFISPVGIFPCIGARDERTQRRLQEAFASGNWESVRSLRRDTHEATDTCWLHGAEWCLSTVNVSG